MLKQEDPGDHTAVSHQLCSQQSGYPPKGGLLWMYPSLVLFLKRPLLPAAKGGPGARQLSDMTWGGCPGQPHYLWASYPLLPGPPVPAGFILQYCICYPAENITRGD